MSRYGWIRQLPDQRDQVFGGVLGPACPPSDMRLLMPPVYDQGEISSCTGNACAAAIAYARSMQGLPTFTPSRLMLYYDARALEGTTSVDCGAQIRDVIKGAAIHGACDEANWAYEPSGVTARPSDAAYAAGMKDRAIGYKAVPQNLDFIRLCLSGGDPIVFGMSIYQSFESDEVARTGIVPMPGMNEAMLGGHAVLAVGHNDDRQVIIVRNSWGEDFGDSGYFYLPYQYVTSPNLASDLWTIRLVSSGISP
jgi:C1A family cysteine protease